MEDRHNVLSATLDSPCTDKVGVQPMPVGDTHLDTHDVVVVHSVDAIATSTQLHSFTLQLKLRLRTQLLLKCAKHIHILILIHINAQHMDEASFI